MSLHDQSMNATAERQRKITAALWLMLMLYSPCLPHALAQEKEQEKEQVSIQDLTNKMDAMQKEYERRISDLELNLDVLNSLNAGDTNANASGMTDPWREDDAASGPSMGDQSMSDQSMNALSMGASPGVMGRLGQTTRFSRTFNPAIGVALDGLGSRSVSNDTQGELDKFWLRAAEVNLSAQVDPYGYAYAVVEGTADEIELIEAAAVMNRLPGNFSLKGGKFLSDFGKFGQRHDHELPFVEKPLVYYDYIGGSLNSTGVEVHQWFGLTDHLPVRWSVGMLNGMEGHSHTLWFGEGHVHTHADDSFGVNDKRQLDNFAYTGRLTGYRDLTDHSSLQVGTSIVWAPEKVEVEEEGGVDTRIDTRQTVAGADVTYKWVDPGAQSEFVAGVEGFQSHGTFHHDDVNAVLPSNALGGYAWAEYSWNPYWSTGIMGGSFERAQHDNVGRREASAWVTWKISHFNWLRFQYRFNDLERHGTDFTGRDFSEFLLQWTLVFGTHAHAMDW